MMRNTLGLLVKYPEPGYVKTRLAGALGSVRAADIYRLIAEEVFLRTKPKCSEYERMIFYAPSSEKARFESWLPGENLLPQSGGDIGDIMTNALGYILRSGAERAVIAGVDIPQLERDIVLDAFAALEDKDVVVGPALDGGYYLIGMKSLHYEIFQHISWSTDKVFCETVRIIERLGLRYSAVKQLSDLDRIEDMAKFGDLSL